MQLCGLVAFGVGAVALCGWIFDISALKTVLPGLMSMKANTAIGLAGSGASLVMAMQPRKLVSRSVAMGLALLVGLIGGATLVEYASQVDLGIDTLLFSDPNTPSALFPGRPSQATAAALVLLSAALLSLMSSSRLARLVLWSTSLAGVPIAVFAILNYAYDLRTLYDLGPFSSIALHTATALLILFTALQVWSCRNSLKLPLVSLAALILAPLAAVMVYFAHAERQSALNENRERADGRARLLAAEQGEIFGQAEALLRHLVRIADIRVRAPDCDKVLESLALIYPWVTWLKVSNLDGVATCTSNHRFADVNIADREYFHEAINQRRFVISDVLVSRSTKQPRLVAALPLIEQDRVTAVITLGMDLSIFGDLIRRNGLRPGTSATVLDETGTVIAQEGNGPDLVGTNLIESPIVARAVRERSGSADALDWDGRERLFAFRPVPGADVIVLIGLDRQSVIGSIDRTLQGRLFFIALIMAGAAIAGLIGAELLIFQPLRKLARTAHLIEEGDVTARPNTTGRAEVGALGRAFAKMADAVADREQRLNEALARHTAVFDSAIDGIITINESGSIESFNPAAERLFGHAASAIMRRQITTVLPNDDPQAGASFGALAGAGSGLGQVQEMQGLRADASTFPVDVALSEMRLGARRLIVAIVRDASERKRNDRLKNEFVSTVSHELRTPLTSIAGSLGLLAGGAVGAIPDGAKRLIAIAHQNTQRLVRLINDILDLEKIESGKLAFTRAPVELRELAAEAIEANQGFSQEHAIHVALEAGAAEVTVLGDRDRLMQVVTNLLSNAIKFSSADGNVRVVVGENNGRARLSVIDQGVGIPAEFRSRIFTKFAQADASDTRQKGGTGLGLAISKEIAELHAGTLAFETEPGRGTAFHVDLPASAPSVTQDQPDLSADVLVVEDDRDTVTVLRQMLARSGFTAAVAATARQAESIAAMGRFKVILVDLGLPDRDGITLIRALRTHEATRRTPIIVVTARARDAAEAQETLALEVLDWIEKPVDPARLKAAVELAAGASGSARVLHVEDDPDLRQLVAQALARCGTVHSVATTAEAEQAIAAFHFDIVILDMNLPDGSGGDLLPKLRRPSGETIPIVVFSARDADPDLARKVEFVLTKTHDSLEHLVRVVARLCRSDAPPDTRYVKAG
jgi:PAS domain S-box-containing protein